MLEFKGKSKIFIVEDAVTEARNHLKTATLFKHKRLDHELSALRLGEVDDYLTFLVFNAPVLSLERALEDAGVGLELPDWPLRARADALRADLASLGVRGLDEAPETALPNLADPAARLGLAYVLEGSRLGAAVLRRTVRASADGRVLAATRFVDHGFGHDLWRGFLARLEPALADPADRDLAARTATWAFDVFLARAEAMGLTSAPIR